MPDDLPPEAIEAAAQRLWEHEMLMAKWGEAAEPNREAYRVAARDLLSAALPHLRAWTAAQIDAAARLEAEAYDPEGQPLAAKYREWWHTGMANAARVARGDQP
jgi:hypothetical protein